MRWIVSCIHHRVDTSGVASGGDLGVVGALLAAVTEDAIASGGVVVLLVTGGSVVVLAAASSFLSARFVGVGGGDLGDVGAAVQAATGARSIVASHRLQNRVAANITALLQGCNESKSPWAASAVAAPPPSSMSSSAARLNHCAGRAPRGVGRGRGGGGAAIVAGAARLRSGWK